MPTFNVSRAKKQLDGVCILITDSQNAKLLKIEDNKIAVKSIMAEAIEWKEKTGYFKGTTGGGTTQELHKQITATKRFLKSALKEANLYFKNTKCEKFAIMCLPENVVIIREFLTFPLQKVLIGIKQGNFTKASVNEILEHAIELF